MPWKPDYITVDELAADERIGDHADDVQLQRYVTMASRAVDDATNRQFGKVDAPEARLYTARWSKSKGAWVVPIDDLQTAVGLVVKVDTAHDGTYATTLAAADFVLRPRNAVLKGQAWTELLILSSSVHPRGTDGEFQATAPWGWTTVPITVKGATSLQASRFAARRDAPFGVAGSPESGTEMRLLAKVDPDVAVALRDYKRKVWAR